MNRLIKIEVLIATPPTKKCDETVRILENVVRKFPDECRLVIFRRGIDFVPPEIRTKSTMVSEEDCAPKEASVQMRALISKGRTIPTVVVDGVFFSTVDIPDEKQLENKISEMLSQSN